MSAIRLIPVHDDCVLCDSAQDVRALAFDLGAASGDMYVVGIALCAQCRIRAEAVLREGRKRARHAPRNWGPGPSADNVN